MIKVKPTEYFGDNQIPQGLSASLTDEELSQIAKREVKDAYDSGILISGIMSYLRYWRKIFQILERLHNEV